jgi:hypothetical protein
LNPRYKLWVIGGVLVLLVAALAWLALRLRRRWRKGKEDFEQMKKAARQMELTPEGMAGAAPESRRRKPSPRE